MIITCDIFSKIIDADHMIVNWAIRAASLKNIAMLLHKSYISIFLIYLTTVGEGGSLLMSIMISLLLLTCCSLPNISYEMIFISIN